jgi:hypothetical protein
MPITLRSARAGVLLIGLLLAGQALGWVQARFIHAAPISEERSQTAISLYIAGDFSVGDSGHSYELHNILYRQFTGFFGYPPADFDIVIRSGIDDARLVDTTVTLESGRHHWIILTGDGENEDFAIHMVNSELPAHDSGQHALRFIHTAPVAEGAPAGLLAIRDLDGQAFATGLADLGYGQASPDVLVPPGELQFAVHASGQAQPLLRPAPVHIEPGTQGTALLMIGDGHRQPLSILSVPGGELTMLTDEGEVPPVLDNSVLGWWDTANTAAGEGLLLQPMPDQQRLVGTIYTYAADGSGQQRWYVIESCRPDESGSDVCPDQAGFDGRQGQATVFAADGSSLGGDEPSTLSVVGWIELEFVNCDQGTAHLSLDDGSSVHWELARLTQTVPCSLE